MMGNILNIISLFIPVIIIILIVILFKTKNNDAIIGIIFFLLLTIGISLISLVIEKKETDECKIEQTDSTEDGFVKGYFKELKKEIKEIVK